MSIAPHAPINRYPLYLAKRCGAYARQTGEPCKQPAMKNGRCRLHGGKSTGAITDKGKLRAKLANYRHGQRTQSQATANRSITDFITGAKLFSKKL